MNKSSESLSQAMSRMASLKHWGDPPREILGDCLETERAVDCGWGKLIFAQTFDSPGRLAEALGDESPGQRNVALYTRDPQIVVSQAPGKLFIDPSLTFRLELDDANLDDTFGDSLQLRTVEGDKDREAINRIYKSRAMVTLRETFELPSQASAELVMLVACDPDSGAVVGCVTGVDHGLAFDDPDNGSSLWALAVDPQCPTPGVGRALVIALAARFRERGRSFMDLSVMHDNDEAIGLYQAIGFYQVPVYCLKVKNAINERLYTGPRDDEGLNIYARIIVDEAYRRGIAVDVVDGAGGFFDLSLGGATIHCRESLSDLTSAVAMSRCDDKAVTARFLRRAGLEVPEQQLLEDEEAAVAFLKARQRIVIKPAQGEQGIGVHVDLREEARVREAYRCVRELGERVLGETCVAGDDLRVIVINDEVVAAALREPATIVGDGRHRIDELIEKQSRRRASATDGESRIPMDEETRRCVEDGGYRLGDVLPRGKSLRVRKTANLHTGGCLHDVTGRLHPELVRASISAARALDIPVVGLDLIVTSAEGPDYTIIEANERPGLANHEPQPTAERFLDLLFPQSIQTRESPR